MANFTDFQQIILTKVREIVDQKIRQETYKTRWATVTNTSPLRILYDGESAALGITPPTLVSGLAVGDRVLVAWQKGQIVILGKAQ